MVTQKVKMNVASAFSHQNSRPNHDDSNYDIDEGVDAGTGQPGAQKKIREFRTQSALKSEGQGKIKSRLNSFFSRSALEGVAEGDRPGMLIRQNPVEKPVSETL